MISKGVRDMRNIAVITARSGSKGIKDKNIKLLNGKPLMSFTIETALQSGIFEKVMVSTDSKEYASIAETFGAEVPFLRSDKNSRDDASSWETVKEVLSKYKRLGMEYDTVCLLQPTSPLRKSEDIIRAYDLMKDKGTNAVTSVCVSEHPAEYMMTLGEDMLLDDYRQSEVDLPRQFLPVYYRINGAIYIRRIIYDGEDIEILNFKERAYLMDTRRSVDIDSEEDFEYAEYLMCRGRI